MNSETMPCAHDACTCQVTAVEFDDSPEAGDAYCSADCRSAMTGEERFDDACPCGHPACDTP